MEVRGLSKSSTLIRLKTSSLVLVVISSMSMPVCNRFHETLANNGIYSDFYGGTVFDALVCRFHWTLKIETWIVEIYVQCWKFYMQLLHACLNWFRRNSLLKCVSQPEIAKKSIKPLFWRSRRSSHVTEFGGNREPMYDFLLVINSNLSPILHRYWDTATYWPKIANFSYFLLFSTLVRGELLRIYEKLYGSWN